MRPLRHRLRIGTLLIERFAKTAQEEAEKINTQVGSGPYGMSLVTDQEHWEEQGIFTGEDLAISLLSQTYSDYYKEVHGFRPRHGGFASVEEAQREINKLDDWVSWEIEQEKIDAERQAKIEKEREELEALMPGEFDFEELPKRGPMRPRNEGAVRLTTSWLREIIDEAMRGETKTHPLTDLARRQAKTFGHGVLADVDGYENLVGMGLDFTRGVAPSAAAKGPLSEARVRHVVRKILRKVMK